MAQRQLGVEHTDAPRLGEDGRLDGQDVAQVPSLQLLDAQFHAASGGHDRDLRGRVTWAKLLVASASRM
jgi:hypothetical protein